MGITLASLRGDAPERQPVRVYVNREAVVANEKDGGERPCICVRWPDGSATATNLVHITGDSTVHYSKEGTPDGAHVWIETFDTVNAEGERVYPR